MAENKSVDQKEQINVASPEEEAEMFDSSASAEEEAEMFGSSEVRPTKSRQITKDPKRLAYAKELKDRLKQEANKPMSEDLRDFARAFVGQGMMFGLGDEAEATVTGSPLGAVKSLVEGATTQDEDVKKYREARDKIRSEVQKFKDDNALAGYGSELLGAAIGPGLAVKLGKYGLKTPAAISEFLSKHGSLPGAVAGGAVAGYGTSDSDVGQEQALGSTLGAGIGGVVSKFPKASLGALAGAVGLKQFGDAEEGLSTRNVLAATAPVVAGGLASKLIPKSATKAYSMGKEGVPLDDPTKMGLRHSQVIDELASSARASEGAYNKLLKSAHERLKGTFIKNPLASAEVDAFSMGTPSKQATQNIVNRFRQINAASENPLPAEIENLLLKPELTSEEFMRVRSAMSKMSEGGAASQEYKAYLNQLDEAASAVMPELTQANQLFNEFRTTAVEPMTGKLVREMDSIAKTGDLRDSYNRFIKAPDENVLGQMQRSAEGLSKTDPNLAQTMSDMTAKIRQASSEHDIAQAVQLGAGDKMPLTASKALKVVAGAPAAPAFWVGKNAKAIADRLSQYPTLSKVATDLQTAIANGDQAKIRAMMLTINQTPTLKKAAGITEEEPNKE